MLKKLPRAIAAIASAVGNTGRGHATKTAASESKGLKGRAALSDAEVLLMLVPINSRTLTLSLHHPHLRSVWPAQGQN